MTIDLGCQRVVRSLFIIITAVAGNAGVVKGDEELMY
jgi:hypothetical protein